MATKGRSALGEDAGQRVDLLLEKEAGDGGQISGGAHDGTLGAVSGAEGIENEDVTIGSELLGDLGIVLLLTLIEADVLENENLARLDGSDSLGSLLAVGVGDKGNVETREAQRASWRRARGTARAGSRCPRDGRDGS